MAVTTVIEPGKTLRNYWSDLWSYRELFYFLAWRDILVLYKQTVIGIAWSVIRPLLTMLIFTVVFSRIAHLPSDGVPYPVLVFVALLPWQFFANALSASSNSLIDNSSMLTKVYFPRLIIPSAAIIVSIVDFLISLVILFVLMAWYHFAPSWHIITLPLFFLLDLIVTFGFGLWLSALNVTYRDFRIIVPFLVQFGLYISPVGFTSNIVSAHFRLLYSLNPMVGVIDGFRWAVLGNGTALYLPGFFLSIVIALALLLYGLYFFRKMERSFADVI